MVNYEGKYPYSSSNSPTYLSITSTIYKITIYLQTALLRLYNPNVYPRNGEKVVPSINQVKADEKAVRNCLHHLQLHAWQKRLILQTQDKEHVFVLFQISKELQHNGEASFSAITVSIQSTF